MRRMGTVVALLCAMVTLVGPSPARAEAVVFVDSTPSSSWQVDGTVYATLIVGDRVFVGGDFANAVSSTGQSVARKNLAAFSLTTGALATTWQADAVGVVRALASDGTALYVGGNFSKVGTTNRTRVAKVNVASGAVDQTFSASFDSTVRALALDGGSLFVGGTFTTANSVSKSRIAKVDATTGALDGTFAATANNAVYALRVKPGGGVVYVAGNFSTLDGTSRTGMGAVTTSTGALTGPTFASSARPTFGLDISPDGTTLYGAGGGATNAAAAWNTTSGTRLWRVVAEGDIQTIRYFGGTVYFGFHDGYQGDAQTKLLAVDATTGAVDPNFIPNVIGFWGLWALDITDEGLVIGGDFTRVNGVPAQGWARFPRTGQLPPPAPVQTEYVGTSTQWSYFDKGAPPAGWNTEAFDSSTWAKGLTQLGYGDGDESTVLSWGPSSSSKYLAYYFRATFDLSSIPDSLVLQLAADDGAVAYLNGTEVVRDNMPTGMITNTTRASSGRSGGNENAVRQFTVDPATLHLGTNTVAVEVHQDTPSSSDLTFDASVIGMVSPPPNAPPVAELSTTVSGLSVTFDGSQSSDSDGNVIDFRWDFGDGTTGAGAIVQHAYTAEGTYTVSLRVTDDDSAHDTVVGSVTALSPTVTTDVVATGATWQWRYLSGEPPTGWNQPGFDASAWSSGAAPLGFGSSLVVTNIDTFSDPASRPKAAYFSRTFEITDLSKVQQVVITTVADDGVAVYVNGTEVGRSNMPAGALTSSTSASSARNATTAANSPVTISVPLSLLTAGTNTIAAETHLNYRATTDAKFRASVSVTSQR